MIIMLKISVFFITAFVFSSNNHNEVYEKEINLP